MIKIKEAIIVEGKYDKIRLSNFIDGLIITTDGFGIFKDKEKQAMIRSIAEKRGLLILTDSDGAGFVIRNFLKGTVPSDRVKHAYIPDIFGKEKRKAAPSKEGKLGVEGISEKLICEAIVRSGVECELTEGQRPAGEGITKTDLYEFGLTGGADSSKLRDMLKKELGLPQKLSSNSFLQVLNCMMTRDEFFELMKKHIRSTGG